MMAVLELPPRLACSMRVSLLSLNGTWLLPCTTPCYVTLITTFFETRSLWFWTYCARHVTPVLQLCSSHTFMLHKSDCTSQLVPCYVCISNEAFRSTESNALEANMMTHDARPHVGIAQGTHQALHGTSHFPDGYSC